MGIRGQLTFLVPGVVLAGLVSIAFLAAERQRADELTDLRVRATQVLQSIGVTAAVDVAQNDMAGLDTLLAHLAKEGKGSDLLELGVVDGDGRIVAHTDPEKFNTVWNDPFVRAAVNAEEPVWKRDGSTLRLGVPARSGLRWATVVASYSLSRLEASVQRTRLQWLGFALVLSLLSSAVLFFALDRLVVRPIRALQLSVRRMGEGSLNSRAPPLKGLEMSELSQMVNKMAGTLQAERDNLEKAVAERTRELQELNQRLERLAVTDGLTGVFNHRRFQEALAAELLRSQRTQRPCSVLMCDVDLFKRVNDSLGHPAGDELLRRLAVSLQTTLRQTDLLARYGGEEFAALLPETTKAEAVQVAERMRAAVQAQVNLGDKWPHDVTISIGVATSPDDGGAPEPVLQAADQALYLAKHQGRNRVVSARPAA